MKCKHMNPEGFSTVMYHDDYRLCLRCMALVMSNRQHGNPEKFSHRPLYPYTVFLNPTFVEYHDQF